MLGTFLHNLTFQEGADKDRDPIVAALSILSIEVLCIRLRTSQDIIGFTINGKQILLSLYADDCSIFLEC